MVDDGRYSLLSRPRFIGYARINSNGWDSEIPTAFHIYPEPSTTGLTLSPSESWDSERLDSSRCLAWALASQVMATHRDCSLCWRNPLGKSPPWVIPLWIAVPGRGQGGRGEREGWGGGVGKRVLGVGAEY
jgi:hypothetical protein